MPIDPEKALQAHFEPSETSYDEDQVILYHLGVGAGAPNQTDAGELEYCYEKQLKVLPSFGVVPVFGAMGDAMDTPGLDFNPALLLHGEQDIEVHRPLPARATLLNQSRIAGIYDKGKAALLVMEVASREKGGAPLFTNRFSLFLRGEGGFGGEPGPAAAATPPERAADEVIETPTLPQQALLYRLCGDRNPLHADPEFAKLGGFDTPILHGLCSFGINCKVAVDHALGGDVTRVARYRARFAGVFFPGETMVTHLWREDDVLYLRAEAKERGGAPVITNASLTLRA